MADDQPDGPVGDDRGDVRASDLDDDEIRVCPDCGSSTLYHRGRSSYIDPDREGDDELRYRCRDCGSQFDVPGVRERQRSGGGSGLAAKLRQADPEDVPALSDGD